MDSPSASQARIHRAAIRLFAERGSSQVNVSELAQAAGVARGTIYNNLADTEALFDEVAARLSAEMNERIAGSFQSLDDPAARLAQGIRLYLRRCHEEPDWGRFVCRFAFTASALRQLWLGTPAADLKRGIDNGRYTLHPDQLLSALGMIAGTVLAAMVIVLDGHKTWREAGSDAAELCLCGLGLPRHEARAIARSDMQP